MENVIHNFNLTVANLYIHSISDETNSLICNMKQVYFKQFERRKRLEFHYRIGT